MAALAEQDDVATCFFVWTQADAKRPREEMPRTRKTNKASQRVSEPEDPYYLLVITRSGAWYKLSLSHSTSTSAPATTSKSGSSNIQAYQGRVKDAHKHSLSSTAQKAGAGEAAPESNKCRLVEYRRIGYGTDGEEDEDKADFDIDVDFDQDSDGDSDE